MGPGTTLRAERSLMARVALAVIGAMLTLIAWLYASPPGSSPDDGYHLGSIWCAGGFVEGRCLEVVGSADPDVAFAPSVLPQLTCVAGDGRRSAKCQSGIYERFEGQLSRTAANISGVRATLYYRTANLLVSDDIAASIARIRVMNAALVLLLVGLTALVAAADVRRALLLSWLVASVPLGLFLATSLNSTAWGIAGLGTLWANVITAARPGERWRRAAAAALALTGGTIALGSRTEAAAHLAVISAALLVLLIAEADWSRRLRLSGRTVAIGAGSIVLAFVVISVVGRFSALDYLIRSTSGLGSGWERLVQRGISNPVLTLAAETPQLWTGALGTWSLGWLDTNMPSTVSVSATVAFVTLVAFGLAGASRARIAASTIILLGMIALPVISLLSVGLVVLEQLQPRHYIPLLYAFLGFAIVRSRSDAPLLIGRGMRNVLAVVLSIGHSVALIINIRRYTSGLTEFLYIDTNREVEWWWGGMAPSPEQVWVMGTVGYAVVAFVLLDLITRRAPAKQTVTAAQS